MSDTSAAPRTSTMPRIADLVVQMDKGAGCVARLACAMALARQHDAHVVGLYVIDLAPAAQLGAAGTDGTGIAMVMDQIRQDEQQAARPVEADFRARLEREGVRGEWRLVEDLGDDALVLHSRHADLALLGRSEALAPGQVQHAAIERVLFGSGRPVLIVPGQVATATPGRRVLVAWNASREAVRAIHDALPLLGGAESVRLVAVDPVPSAAGFGPLPAADMARHLARHGLPVTAAAVASAGRETADVLLEAATDMGADMLVMGGYGHSRLSEMILGGVTRDMLSRATLPVLMAH
jgi:nucleotide-binding universal stress UspA family protein